MASSSLDGAEPWTLYAAGHELAFFARGAETALTRISREIGIRRDDERHEWARERRDGDRVRRAAPEPRNPRREEPRWRPRYAQRHGLHPRGPRKTDRRH